eukprot:6322283-Amphidinium_carterae.1
MLTIDTEGFDTLLVPDFLDLADFWPALLQFEYVNQRENDNVTYALVRRLADLGYDVVASFIDVIASLSVLVPSASPPWPIERRSGYHAVAVVLHLSQTIARELKKVDQQASAKAV